VEEGRIVEVRGIDEGKRYVGRVFDPGLFATITQGESILARRDS
jgi:hypothetical protein